MGFEKKPERIMVVHGEDHVTDSFAELASKEIGCPGICTVFRWLCGSGDEYGDHGRYTGTEEGC